MALTDQSTRIRSGEELDAAIIDAYLKANIPGLSGEAKISQFPGGASNLTYLIEYPQQEFVLRRPPFGHKAKSAHDMGREYRILNQLNAGFPYCPKAYVHCIDESVIGAEFYVMERVKGIILRSDMPAELNFSAEQTTALCKSFIDKLVELHNVDYNACGLGDLGKPEGYVERQIRGWSDRYEKALTPDAPTWEPVKAWLNDKMPADHHKPGIVHNDYRFDNVILDPNNPMQIIGVLDWEMTTIGDPLMDLGNTLAYWIEAGDPAPVQLMRRQPSNAPGMLTRQQFVDYYAEKAGIEIKSFDFYYTYGLFRLAGIVQQIYYRFYHGQTQDKRFAQFIHMNKLLAQQGAHVIVSSRKIDGCQAVADAITAEGGKATAIACHIGEMEQITNVFAQIREQFGRLDILVNNAATNPQFCNVLDTDLSAFQKTVDVNIRGYYFMSIEGGKLMKENGGGSIINVASINGVTPGEFQGIYSVTKAAVISMTKVFAKECAQFGIRCNALLPGLTDTKFASALTKNDAILKHALQRIPLKRVADPSEMAGAVLYLASEASSYTTGVALNVDGGFLA